MNSAFVVTRQSPTGRRIINQNNVIKKIIIYLDDLGAYGNFTTYIAATYMMMIFSIMMLWSIIRLTASLILKWTEIVIANFSS